MTLFHWAFDTPFFTGVASSTEVPGRFPIALAGHTYMVDLMSDQTGLRGQYFRRVSVPVLRAQADTSAVPNEASLSPDDMWRYSRDSWHLGAGQTHSDRKNISSDYRFRSSKGVNVWTRWQATLLPDTLKQLTSANTVRMVTAGAYTYLIDGQALKFSTNITAASPSFTTVTGTPAATAAAIATDGYTIYVAYPGGLYTTTRGAAAATAAGDTNSYGLLGYVKGRLMGTGSGANAYKLYNITSLAAPSTVLFTHPNTDFAYVGFAAGPSQVYAAGFSGDKSLIYRTAVKADGTALDIPQVAGELPDGEIVRSILGYLGMLVIGSDAGVRIASPDSAGNLTIGGLIPLSAAVKCLVGYGQYVYFGWTNYDATSTGLGRLDLANFTSQDVPAYASDLMATAQGTVGSVVMVGGQPVFGVDTVGVYAPSANLVPSGTIDSGLLAYDLADEKTAMFLNTRCTALPAGASITSSISGDGGAFSQVGAITITSSTGPAADFTVGQVKGETFELRQTLAYATDHTQGPTLTRHTLRSYPTPSRSFEWTIPLLIHERVSPYGDGESAMNVTSEMDFLFGLLNTLVTLQVGNESFQVFVQDVDQIPFQLVADKSAYASTVVVHLLQPAAA